MKSEEQPIRMSADIAWLLANEQRGVMRVLFLRRFINLLGRVSLLRVIDRITWKQDDWPTQEFDKTGQKRKSSFSRTRMLTNK